MGNKIGINSIYKIGICFSIVMTMSVTMLNAQNLIKGKKIFETRCLVCHQADGGGVPNMNPPLDGSTGVNGKDIVRMVKIVTNGLDERVALDGMYYNNAMTANPDLKADAIADVLSYIRNSWSNKAGLVTVAQVNAALLKNKSKKK
jgi:mono/diheme cytochrome c family protein